MRWSTPFALLLSLATLWGCSTPKLFAPAAVPPRVNLQGYGALGLVEFASNSDTVIGAQTTREFESHIQSAQPGARFIDLGSRESLLAAVGAEQLDARALRRIGRKYGVDAIFVGDLSYSVPNTEATASEAGLPAGGELRADIAYTLMETRSGDSIWRNSASARRPFDRMKVAATQRTGGAPRAAANAHEEMVPALVYRLTEDFRPSSL
jgi:hypothetical protein